MSRSNKGVGVEETAEGGVIIAGLEVIQADALVVDIAAVAQGVMGAEGCGQGAGGIAQIAPGIVGVGHHGRAGTVQDRNHIALQIYSIIVGSTIVGDRLRIPGSIGSKGEGIAAHRHLRQLTTCIDVAVSGAAVAAPGAHSVGIVGIIPGGTAAHACQLPAMLPGVGPGAVADDIACG